jgi:hypothetical protein
MMLWQPFSTPQQLWNIEELLLGTTRLLAQRALDPPTPKNSGFSSNFVVSLL